MKEVIYNKIKEITETKLMLNKYPPAISTVSLSNSIECDNFNLIMNELVKEKRVYYYRGACYIFVSTVPIKQTL